MQITEIRIGASFIGLGSYFYTNLVELKYSSSNFEASTAMTLKLQVFANFGMFFHVMQTIRFIHVFVR